MGLNLDGLNKVYAFKIRNKIITQEKETIPPEDTPDFFIGYVEDIHTSVFKSYTRTQLIEKIDGDGYKVSDLPFIYNLPSTIEGDKYTVLFILIKNSLINVANNMELESNKGGDSVYSSSNNEWHFNENKTVNINGVTYKVGWLRNKFDNVDTFKFELN